MTIYAVALLKVPADRVAAKLGATPIPDRPNVRKAKTAGGDSVSLESIDDGTVLFTHLDFGSEPAALSAGLRALLGEVLDEHNESRGVLVFPSKAKTNARTYAAVVDDVGELGSWIARDAKPAATKAPAIADGKPATAGGPSMAGGPIDMGSLGAQLPPGFAEQMQALMQAIPPDAMSAMQGAVMSGDPDAMANVQRQLEAAMGGPEALARMQESLAGMLGDMGVMPGEGDPEAMMDQARAELDSLKETDPERWAEVQKQLGSMGIDPDATTPIRTVKKG